MTTTKTTTTKNNETKNNETKTNTKTNAKTNNEPKTNATKNNSTFDYEKFFNSYIECHTKHDIVSVCTTSGIYTTTKPTDTNNMNDLYIQLFDKSRIKLNKTSLQVYTCNDVSIELEKLFGCKSDLVSDGSYRTNRLTLSKSVDTIKSLFEYFSKKTLLYISQIPTKTETKTTTVIVEK